MLRAAAVAALLALAACGGTDASSGPKAVTAAEAQTWPAKWCQTSPGMTRDQVVAIMGEPTERFTESFKWLAFEFRYSAFFDSDGTARQLDMDSALAGRSSCAVTRTR